MLDHGVSDTVTAALITIATYEILSNGLGRSGFLLDRCPECVHDVLVLSLTGQESYGDCYVIGVFGLEKGRVNQSHGSEKFLVCSLYELLCPEAETVGLMGGSALP